MHSKLFKVIAIGALIAGGAIQAAYAQRTLKIMIPKRSRLTPVQRLNRAGVEAVQKNNYRKAEQLFYKAYLYDPSDPFTLNNLGYVSELQGQLDRANSFYKMASKQGCSANIDMSNISDLKGKPMTFAFENLHEIPMQVNRMNVDAMMLLSQGRAFEASSLLQHALNLEPQNAFTLNNLGAADETIGDYSDALKYYKQAADSSSAEAVVVTENRNWSGRPITKMAAANAARLQKWMRSINPAVAEAALYNRRGVYATNENNWGQARQDFLRAYRLDPSSPFSLNNRGYVAEMDGDLESAQFFYQKAQQAGGASARVGAASDHAMLGETLSHVAADSTFKVNGALATYSRRKHVETGPIQLTPRNGAQEAPPATGAPQAPNPPGRNH
ncbi:MAG TPA: tetratricopeptide repeat protein [Terracidiphilus sp.]|nr:tetratricopeptide repeat protein [Terracidiphilus sp.]